MEKGIKEFWKVLKIFVLIFTPSAISLPSLLHTCGGKVERMSVGSHHCEFSHAIEKNVVGDNDDFLGYTKKDGE